MAGERDDSYQVGSLADPDQELGRLERQAQVARALEMAWLKGLAIDPGSALADIGCGPGFMTHALAQLVPEGSVVGVDTDADLVAQAQASVPPEDAARLRFVHASAEGMPLDSASVDLAYARFLVQHLPRPAAVLAEIRRIVRPGGRVVVVDTDDGGLALHPEPTGFQALLAASQAAQERRGGDRHVGRKLKALLQDVGLEDVTLEVVPFTSEQVGMEAFLDICLGFKSLIIDDAEMPRAAVQEALSAARALTEEPTAFGQALGYVAVGVVPT